MSISERKRQRRCSKDFSDTESTCSTVSKISQDSALGYLADIPLMSDDDEESTTDDQTESGHNILKGVVAFIEVRSNTENRSKCISKQVEMLGAKVSKKFTSDVTHVIFKDGKRSTQEKAKKKNIPVVSVLWIENCKQSGKRLPENIYPPISSVSAGSPLMVKNRPKRYKSMQPKSFEEELGCSAERVARNRRHAERNKLRESLDSSSCIQVRDPRASNMLGTDTCPGASSSFGQCTSDVSPHRMTQSQSDNEDSEKSAFGNLAKQLRFDDNSRLFEDSETADEDILEGMMDVDIKQSRNMSEERNQVTHSSTEDKPSTCSMVLQNQRKISLRSSSSRRNSLDDFRLQKHVKRIKSDVNHRRKKRTHRLVMTALHSHERDLVLCAVEKLGYFRTEDSVCHETSHVIAGCPRRTLNVLKAISCGCWLLSLKWVEESLLLGHWVDEKPHELSDHFPKAQSSRLERQAKGDSYRCNLFKDVPPIYVGTGTSPSFDEIVNLIEMSGGNVSASFRSARICLGHVPKKTEATFVSEKWLIDCIASQEVLPLDEYRIECPTISISTVKLSR